MFATYAGCVPAEADLVCYWFENAGRQIASGNGPGCRLYARKPLHCGFSGVKFARLRGNDSHGAPIAGLAGLSVAPIGASRHHSR